MPNTKIDSVSKTVVPVSITGEPAQEKRNMRIRMTKVTLVKPMLGKVVLENKAGSAPAASDESEEKAITKDTTVGDEAMSNVAENKASDDEIIASVTMPVKAKSKVARPKVGRPAGQKVASGQKSARKKQGKAKEHTLQSANIAATPVDATAQSSVKHEEALAGITNPGKKIPSEEINAKSDTSEKAITSLTEETKPDKTGLADRIQINQLQKELARIELAKDLAEDAKVRQMDFKFTIFVVVLFIAVMLGLAALINNHKTEVITVSTPSSEPVSPPLAQSKTTLELLDKPAQSDAIANAPETVASPGATSPAAAEQQAVPAANAEINTATQPISSTAQPSTAVIDPAAAAQEKAAQSENLLSILNKE